MSNSAQTKDIRGKGQVIILALVIGVLLVGILSLQAFGNKEVTADNQETVVQSAPEEAADTDLTVWRIIGMTDWLLWPFILITAAGILMIIYYSLQEHQDKSRSRMLLRGQIQSNNIKNLGRILQASKPNRVAALLDQMMNTFNKTKHAEAINDDINQFLNGERESFETFNRVTGFLSDTAGALGLLGTVWGIFQTFHAGKLDGPTILQGMSISLVTTLVGLIISLLLNMGSTYVFTIFNGQLKLVSSKAEELRQALLLTERKPINTTLTIAEPPRNGKSKKSHIENRQTANMIY